MARVLQIFRLPDGTLRVLVEGVCRARLRRLYRTDDFLRARFEALDEVADTGTKMEALMRSVLTSFNEYVRLSRKVPEEVLATIG